ncbi:DUF2569 family protein [Paenibacillus thiaminolyticus]|uniref:DUF2569 family protein n=1 Tax=Paenibacillus thiaminolyticus TaxID=49283 RepID=UPI003B97F4ED
MEHFIVLCRLLFGQSDSGGGQDADSLEALKPLVRSSILSVIWIIYFIRSKRVKATFVN